jgi:hypothetical protein
MPGSIVTGSVIAHISSVPRVSSPPLVLLIASTFGTVAKMAYDAELGNLIDHEAIEVLVGIELQRQI